jgi:acetate kinase
MRVLVVNAGSSSLKLSVLDHEDSLVCSEELDAPGGRVDEAAVKKTVTENGPIDAVGHRVVHGGTEFTAPVLIDDQVLRRLELLTDLAPLHQPKSLRALEVVSRILTDVPAVACFDTAFHATIPAAAATYALPLQWRERWDLRRFGFHGLSHSYASRRVNEMVRAADTPAAAQVAGPDHSADAAGRADEPFRPAPLLRPDPPFRLVTCHLGAGASLAAVQEGASVDTTMGFTPLEGLVMATRSGSVDPGLLLWLEEHVGMPSSELASALEHRSGLLGLSGTADMRAVLSAEAAGDARAALAMSVYLHRLRGAIASMVAAMAGLDALVFTGGVGERSAAVRWRAAEGLSFLGLHLDRAANEEATADQEISAPAAKARTFVIEAREDLEIARGVRQMLGGCSD